MMEAASYSNYSTIRNSKIVELTKLSREEGQKKKILPR